MRANQEIRNMIRAAGLHNYEVADAMGMQDTNFSKLLRKELPKDKRNRIVTIIHELSGEKVIA